MERRAGGERGREAQRGRAGESNAQRGGRVGSGEGGEGSMERGTRVRARFLGARCELREPLGRTAAQTVRLAPSQDGHSPRWLMRAHATHHELPP
jgi:hypothetical protein